MGLIGGGRPRDRIHSSSQFAFAALAYVMRKTGFSLVSLLIGFLLGPMLEFSLRQALILYKGDWTVFFSKPIALVFLVLTVASLWRFAWKPAKFMDK